MSSYVETPCKTFTAGAAIAAFLRVKLTAGKLAVAGLADREIGAMERPAFADGDVVPVRLRTAQGTCKMVASKSFAAGADVYTAASGKISDVAGVGAYCEGTALDASGGDGEIVEVMRAESGPGTLDTIADGQVTTAKILDANVTTAKLAAGAVTPAKMDFTGLVTKSAAGVAAAGPITVAGTTVGQRLVAVFGAPTAGGALAAKIPGTDFEAVVSVAGQIQQLAAADLHLSTYVFLLAPATS